ncbi:hypothetical protein HHI36_003755 [Cryptolaemus montrouzieri]|uniref:Uncharacterized protein n=1 Tax=Cryptolaemus montrouzieri TaxID=559131 RepID=A0ABD2PFT1_9CUCU
MGIVRDIGQDITEEDIIEHAINSLKHPTPQRLTDFPNLDQNNHDSQPLTKIVTQKRSYAEVLEKNNTPNTPQTGKKITVITLPKLELSTITRDTIRRNMKVA